MESNTPLANDLIEVSRKLSANCNTFYDFDADSGCFIQFYIPFKIISAHMRRVNL